MHFGNFLYPTCFFGWIFFWIISESQFGTFVLVQLMYVLQSSYCFRIFACPNSRLPFFSKKTRLPNAKSARNNRNMYAPGLQQKQRQQMNTSVSVDKQLAIAGEFFDLNIFLGFFNVGTIFLFGLLTLPFNQIELFNEIES